MWSPGGTKVKLGLPFYGILYTTNVQSIYEKSAAAGQPAAADFFAYILYIYIYIYIYMYIFIYITYTYFADLII